MANMEHCRFINTLEDLQDCCKHWDDEDISEEEQKARARLFKQCQRIVNTFDPDDD